MLCNMAVFYLFSQVSAGGWKQELVTGCSVHSQVFGGGGGSAKASGGVTMEVHGGRAGRQTVQRVLRADKSSPHKPDGGSLLLTRENSESTEPPHLEWPR